MCSDVETSSEPTPGQFWKWVLNPKIFRCVGVYSTPLHGLTSLLNNGLMKGCLWCTPHYVPNGPNWINICSLHLLGVAYYLQIKCRHYTQIFPPCHCHQLLVHLFQHNQLPAVLMKHFNAHYLIGLSSFTCWSQVEVVLLRQIAVWLVLNLTQNLPCQGASYCWNMA